jgi:radical SAM protein with 4Fe4S-binding SPASM domain
MKRRAGMLDRAAFRALIDEIAPYATVLMYYFMGEPFLNKHAYEMIRYARDAGLYVETCTNGDFVDAKGVIYSDLNEISFQIGGMTPETHAVYRIRSDLPTVRKNLSALLEERRKHPESNLQINVGFIVMKHNEHEVASFLEWARDQGVDQASVIDPCVRNVVEGHAMLPADRKYWFYDEEAFERGVLKPKLVPHNECTWVWNSIMINWDGSVVPCCRDPNGLHTLGNAFETPLGKIWNGKAATEFRRSIVSDQASVEICKLCSGFGVPRLAPETPVDFKIARLSLDPTPIDFVYNPATGQERDGAATEVRAPADS